MKKGRLIKGFGMIALTLAVSTSAISQVQRAPRGQRLMSDTVRTAVREGRFIIQDRLDLTDKQKEQMISMRAKHQKEMRYERSLLLEKEAHLKTLLNAPDKNESAINSTIDEIAGMKAGLVKKQIANREETKSILTEEQIKKLETLGIESGLRQGIRGKRGPAGGVGMRGRIGPDRHRPYHGRGLYHPWN